MGTVKLRTFLAVEKHKYFLKIFGIWPSEVSTKFLSILYNFYGLMIVIIVCIMYDLTLILNMPHVENKQEATENFCVNLTFLAFFGKFINFKIFVRQIQRALHHADDFTLENDQEILFAGRKMQFFKTLCTNFYVAVNVCLCLSFIGPFVVQKVTLPVAAWFPFDWRSNPTTYAWLYIYQVFNQLVQANVNISLDLFMAYLMHVASIKLGVIGLRLEKLNAVQRSEIADKELTKCITCYQRIWR